jgi:hypothetical protein
MPTDTRYAIYFIPPPDTPLYRFGASVLGVDIYTGGAVAFPPGAGANWPDTVREPRTYGFHATLKAPFRLVPGATEGELFAALDAFAADRPRVDAGSADVATINDFIALVPRKPCPPVGELAFACVREFDRFRAPSTEAERERRLRAPLNPRQVRQMDTWGYPFVLDDFRFHMTLTGAVSGVAREQTLRWLKQSFAERATAARLVISQLVVARQTDGAFRVCHTVALREAR